MNAIPPGAYALVVLMTAFTTLIAPPLLRIAFGGELAEEAGLRTEEKTAV
jgi:hypothetical protein